MALISCPECGRQVSDSAVSCPACGYPIAKSNPKGDVMIKMNLQGYIMNIIVYDARTRKELWKGKTGNVAVIHVTEPTNIEIKGRVKITATIRAGEKYELGQEQGLFTVRDVLRRVDVIDTGR